VKKEEKEEINIRIGKRLKRLRKVFSEKTQIEIADDLGISKCQYGKYERGISTISAVYIFKLAELWGIEVNKFFEIKK
jgi:transcriptional regulator with XRE-family HTH domain